MGVRRVFVHIDRVVLKGFRQEDRHAIAAGLQEELGRVFADRAAVSQLRASGDVSRLQVGGVRIAHGSRPERVGERLAQGIGKEMSK
jgi:hypothetical protein